MPLRGRLARVSNGLQGVPNPSSQPTFVRIPELVSTFTGSWRQDDSRAHFMMASRAVTSQLFTCRSMRYSKSVFCPDQPKIHSFQNEGITHRPANSLGRGLSSHQRHLDL